MVTGLHRRMMMRLQRCLASKLYDAVMCMVIVLANESADERLEGIRTEFMTVRIMLEECVKVL